MRIKRDVLAERERCKAIVEKKIGAVIFYREEKIKRRHRRLTFLFKKLLDDILFLIDNPNYVRKTK